MDLKYSLRLFSSSITVICLLVFPVSAEHKKGKGHLKEYKHSILKGHYGDKKEEISASICEGFGPQAPRDINSTTGKNRQLFYRAPASEAMNLCNIHLHKNAEHRASAFSIYAVDGDGHGYFSGYKCNVGTKLTESETSPTDQAICPSKHGNLVAGDTIEVHWVFSSCDIRPGPTLNSCFSKRCMNPQLRVETQVFVLVNDKRALNFKDFMYDGNMAKGLHQPRKLPTGTGTPIEYIGSTTGPGYNTAICSPYQVTWNVRTICAKVHINSIGKFCRGNIFKEFHAHGVRKLVGDPKLLSPIK